MKANELCPSPHLEAADLDGKDMVVTIQGVCFEVVGKEQVEKGVIHFKEFSRGFVVNRTNTQRIVAQYGNDCDDWIGKKITLYPSETDFGGQTVPCIRIRPKK